MSSILIRIAAFSGFIAVTMGAFAAHSLKNSLAERMFSAFSTAVDYQFYHSIALLAVAILIAHNGSVRTLRFAAYGFVAGIVLFSGSLYLLALTGAKIFGPITPIGGLCFMFGWLNLAISSWSLTVVKRSDNG